MYSRNQPSDGKIVIPENYDGTAFSEKKAPEPPKEPAERNIKVLGTPSGEVKMSPSSIGTEVPPAEEEASAPVKEERESVLTGLFGRLPTLTSIFKGGSGFLDSLPIKMPKIGSEEILILGIAFFLLFSKNGDKECAIMLLLLIFIGN